jgi:hypothetical protein
MNEAIADDPCAIYCTRCEPLNVERKRSTSSRAATALVCETVLPRELGAHLRGALAEDSGAFARTEARIEEHRDLLDRLRAYYESFYTRPFNGVRALSDAARGSPPARG